MTTRLIPSLSALLMPVFRKASISGHQQRLADRALVHQRVPHPFELGVGAVFAVAQQLAPGLPLRVGGPATPAADASGETAAPQIERLVGELNDMEVINYDGGVRQAGAHGGPVGR
ncbi:hypothetical protein [Streptomyces sp. NL15-2K]|uniref:hypothetical protein n=1 Tax=Streptomyces sp. NL15-2K TaxID=376149 RepID=UPI00209BBBB8|nr:MULTISPECIES: hypothetical protein [Actinomycetes]WKX14233.1 hypothetical protein Q4V64_44640 [Kutzneria buriramensis]